MHKHERNVKLFGTILCEVFAILTIIYLFADGEADRLALAFGTLLLALLPMLLEKLLRCRICLPVYLFALAYAIGPMLGHCWKLYYTVPVWDKLLHICGGVMFAILGAYLFDFLVNRKDLPAARVIFALCFSVAIAVLWEFCEFGADTFFGMDMQGDTVIHGLTSYLLGDSLGMTGSILNIHSVSVNGLLLPVDGYIDIGLIDTMLDMLLETAGAVVTCVILWLDKGKYPLIQNKQSIHTGDEITVEFDRPTPLQIDGETIPDVTKYTARSAMLNMEEKKDHDFLISVTGQVSNAAVRQ